MTRFFSNLTAAAFAAIFALAATSGAHAAPNGGYGSLKSAYGFEAALLRAAHYPSAYHEDDYEEDDYYEDEDDYRPRKYYKRERYTPRKRCHTEYVSKYVCEQPVPRCLKQRECVWYYGKEYCRYVRKCAHTEKSCSYVKVPRRKCW